MRGSVPSAWLTGVERRWASAVFDTLFPGIADEGLVSITELDLFGFLDQLRETVPARVAWAVRFAIVFVALSPLFVLWRLRTLASLDQVVRERVVTELATSRVYGIRQLVLILKSMGALLYGADARVRRRMFEGHPQRSEDSR